MIKTTLKIENRDATVKLTLNNILQYHVVGGDFNTGTIRQSIDAKDISTTITPLVKIDPADAALVASFESRNHEFVSLYYISNNDIESLVMIPSLDGYYNVDPADDIAVAGEVISITGYALGAVTTLSDNAQMTRPLTDTSILHKPGVVTVPATIKSYLLNVGSFGDRSRYNNQGLMLDNGNIYLESNTLTPVEFVDLGPALTVFGKKIYANRIIRNGVGEVGLRCTGLINPDHVLIPLMF